MTDSDWLAKRFEDNRAHLRTVAYRMLGSLPEAEDAVQEAWLRLCRADTDDVRNLAGWLTTVVSRVCLDMLRTRKTRREDPVGDDIPEPPAAETGPEQQAMLADTVGPALLVVLETLAPAERLAFVLHDMFAVPFDEIAGIIERSPAAARQLASRARRRVQGVSSAPEADLARQREVVDAFLTASRDGDFTALLTVLAPDVVLRADPMAVAGATANQAAGAPVLAAEVRGAASVAKAFTGRARAVGLALVDGAVGGMWAPDGEPRVVFDIVVSGGKIVAIDVVADPAHLAELDLSVL
ncbi:sigma-70 family RNA polymerase sigma factor [Actinokineospora iranica]|uniref:RNA polymerase sigma-70 factor, ECF subfamily n=1 Tax=Actinokineospora iranica TaxID=1271860 RepID=A0A1G6VEG1_9PSEU|nr:sigma-70 family RNA polymerase sigma factor [Actinokineospora iranica]SDD51236.1 RNA polymerase sigma-70 factor, ECF subfamily [Actinokineospora iranica]